MKLGILMYILFSVILLAIVPISFVPVCLVLILCTPALVLASRMIIKRRRQMKKASLLAIVLPLVLLAGTSCAEEDSLSQKVRKQKANNFLSTLPATNRGWWFAEAEDGLRKTPPTGKLLPEAMREIAKNHREAAAAWEKGANEIEKSLTTQSSAIKELEKSLTTQSSAIEKVVLRFFLVIFVAICVIVGAFGLGAFLWALCQIGRNNTDYLS